MNPIFQEALDELASVRRVSHAAYVALSFLRALAASTLATSLWFIADPQKPIGGIVIGLVSFFIMFSFTRFRKPQPISIDDFLLGLDISNSSSNTSPYLAASSITHSPESDWPPRLAREIKRAKALEMRRLTAMGSAIAIPALAAMLLLFKATPSIVSAVAEAQDVLSLFSGDTTLEILSGALDPTTEQKPIKLLGEDQMIDLHPANVLRFSYGSSSSSSKAKPPNLSLVPIGSELTRKPQSFQLNPAFDKDGKTAGWTIEFSAAFKAKLVVEDQVSKTLATLNVHAMPIPEVLLTLTQPLQDPWPDNATLPLKIQVKGHNPLKKVQLKIKSKTRTFSENVASIQGDETLTVNTDYRLSVEPYMDEDFVEFEIQAEATDSSQPQPLTGVSSPLIIRAASAYGRYRQTLQVLTKARSILDDFVSTQKEKASVPAELSELMTKAFQQSEQSPYFDTIDRSDIADFGQSINDAVAAESKSRLSILIDTSHKLSNFLFEHESIDDKERDRDFFVSIRTFSRILEKPQNARPASLEQLTKKISSYLDGRHKRWRIRTDRLGEANYPSLWAKVRDQKPFHRGLADAVSFDHKKSATEAQLVLTNTTALYKNWIDQLEKKEAEFQEKQDKESQQGLANARNELKELQRRQDQVSTNLDRAASRNKEDLDTKWQSARPLLNSNIEQGKGLLEQLQALAPRSGERLSAALMSMDDSLTQGNGGEYVVAESASDLAGRLLRDAEHAAAQKQQQNQRGKRKRAMGDNYYGTPIVGGDVEIKSDYQVDPRYRENILRDITSGGQSDEDSVLLDNYLREVLR